jgi:hypothetical protein
VQLRLQLVYPWRKPNTPRKCGVFLGSRPIARAVRITPGRTTAINGLLQNQPVPLQSLAKRRCLVVENRRNDLRDQLTPIWTPSIPHKCIITAATGLRQQVGWFPGAVLPSINARRGTRVPGRGSR